MWVGIGVGIGRNRFRRIDYTEYNTRVTADSGITEGAECVNAVSGILLNASLLLIPSGYKGGKLYAEIPTNGNGDLTWTRASNGTRVNSLGLIEVVPWNLLLNTNTFSGWNLEGGTLTSGFTAPDGSTTAYKYVQIPGSGLYSGSGGTTADVKFAQVWIKSVSGGSITVDLSDGAAYFGTFNVTGEWQLFTSQYTGNSRIGLYLYGISNASGIYVWHPQLNIGSTAKPYFPTTDRLNVPRLDYMYGSCPSVLLEPQRTNLALYSSAVGGTGWTIISAGIGVSPTVTTNYAVAPDGNTTASRLQLSLGSGTSTSDQSLVVQTLTGTSCRGSFYIKTNDGSTKTIYVRGNLAYSIVIDGTWKRYDFDAGTLSSTQFGIGLRGGQTPTNSNTADILVWGAQLEAGAYPTTYIPTTSATATRVADSFSRSNIYTNGLITSSGGTWFVELRGNVAYTRDAVSEGLFLDTASGGFGNGFTFRNAGGSANRLTITKVISGVLTILYTTTTDTIKVAIKWNGSTADVFVNGTKQVSATAFTTTNMQFLAHATTGDVPKFIQQMALFPTPLTDAQCQTLTTL